MENLIDTYEEVLDFMEELHNIVEDIPEFEDSNWVDNYLTNALKLCSDWLEQNEEEYGRLKAEEEIALNREYERSK